MILTADERAELEKLRAFYRRHRDKRNAIQRAWRERNRDLINHRRKLRDCGIDPNAVTS